MVGKVRRFNQIRKGIGLPPDQPTTLQWMYCAETEEAAEEGWEFFFKQLLGAQYHYFEWQNPSFANVKGYESYETERTADAGRAALKFEERKRTQPIGTPQMIIERIRELQSALRLEKIILHFFFGGMAPEKAEKSLRLFSEKVLPAVQAMETPIHPGSLA